MFKKLFKKKNFGKYLFIHIPKTGGSSFIGLLKDSLSISKQQRDTPTHLIESIENIQIKHVDFSLPSRIFKSPEIFDDYNFKNFNEFKIFMIVRHPVDRLQSEFNFQYHILNGKSGNRNAAIISRLRPLPKTLKDYCSFKETQDYQCKFLLGRNIADDKPITELEFKKIIEAIEVLPIYCGITEKFNSFLRCFERESNISLKQSFLLRKKTPDHLKQNIPENLKKDILKKNKYDYKLYNYIKKQLNTEEEKSKSNFKQIDKKEFIA